MPSLNEIRAAFLGYFEKNDHLIIPSAPLVPQNDPTLLFVNAGMVPFKNYFTGAETPPGPRAASSQKSVRAGGKHNDLDNVGYTARHHTFFEMLGNFSFGDYFKAGAIEHAWTLLTKEFKIPAEKLCVTVYHTDDEAAELWKKIAGLPDEKIIRIATNDNFWSMGDTGPCGPCSEIFYDHGAHIPGGPPGSPDEDGDRFVEIWNLVFMQFEQFADGRRIDLPKPQIDTGMGLERIAAVLQGVHDNYDVDLFRTLIAASKQLVGDGTNGPSHRVIADHLRSTSFLIADGVSPSNEGRGYVLRRIMRRAMRHAHLLGAEEPLMHRLAPVLVAEMGEAYPELRRAEPVIVETLRQEEERFRRTLGRGMALLDEATAGMNAGDMLSGETAFKLYDTYGFPLDLTQDAVRNKGISVDLSGFEDAMKRQREQAREAWTGSGQSAQGAEWFAIRERLGATEFLGYDTTEATGKLLALVAGGAEVESAKSGETVLAVFDRTPFYAESGGQAGDVGEIEWNGGKARVLDTQKQAGDLFVHEIEILQGDLAPGAEARLAVDPDLRTATRANHSATHLLHAALRNVLGPHVSQKGQMVDGERIRFDFSHGGPVTADEIERIEAEVNAIVRQNLAAETQVMAPEKAIEAGAMALFGEKYGDSVRVLTLGRALAGDGNYSVELCGGTHVARTGDIALFKIVSESGVAAGVRRIEALTGEGVMAYYREVEERLAQAAALLKTSPAEVADKIGHLQAELKAAHSENESLKSKLAQNSLGNVMDQVVEIKGVKVLAAALEGVDMNGLRDLGDQLKDKLGQGVVVLASVKDGKVSLLAMVTDEAQKKGAHAGNLVKAAAAIVGGGGGGRPNMAQAGGKNPEKVPEAMAKIPQLVEEQIKG